MVAVMQGGGEPTQAEFHEAITNRADRWFAACLKITRNRAMAEDAVQEALLSAWAKRSQFQHDARLDTWIHRIAVNAPCSYSGKIDPLRLSRWISKSRTTRTHRRMCTTQGSWSVTSAKR